MLCRRHRAVVLQGHVPPLPCPHLLQVADCFFLERIQLEGEVVGHVGAQPAGKSQGQPVHARHMQLGWAAQAAHAAVQAAQLGGGKVSAGWTCVALQSAMPSQRSSASASQDPVHRTGTG